MKNDAVDSLRRCKLDKKLGKNILLNVSYNLLSVIVPFITAPYLGRVLGASNVGEYTYTYSVASYFVMFGLLGISNYGTREIAKVRDARSDRSRTFWEIYIMQLITGLGALLCYFVYICMIKKNSSFGFYPMIFYVATSALDSVWYCSGVEKFRSIVIRNVIIKLTNLLCIFIFVHDVNDLNAYFIIMALGYFISAMILWPAILKEVDCYKPNWSSIKRHFKPNIYLFIPAIAASVFQIMDKVMIGAIASKTQLAYYEYADKILNIPNIVFGAIGAVMLSRMSNVFVHNQSESKKIISYSMDLSLVISIGFTFGALAISNELVSVYYGTNFLETGVILRVLCPVVILYGWNNVLRMQYIIPNNLNSIYISSTIAGAVVNLILNWFFIPKYGALGATIGTMLAQLTITVFYTVQLKSKLPFLEYLKNNALLLVAGCAMCITVSLAQQMHHTSIMGLILDVVIGVTVYAVLCFLHGFKNKNHLINRVVSIQIRR